MQDKYYSPSINILRDRKRALEYIPTRNGEKAFQKITASLFGSGKKTFNIIGAYGSGKSAFILALEKVLNNKAEYFLNPFKDSIIAFESSFLIGSYSSFKTAFCELFEIDQTANVLYELKLKFDTKAISKTGQLIVVDEFGKFLESQTHNL